MDNIAYIHPGTPFLETPMQERLPHADGSRIAWGEPRRLLFRRIARRDGTIVDFRRSRIIESIRSALSHAGHSVHQAEYLADRTIIFLANRFGDRLLSTADVAMAIEAILLQAGLAEAAQVFASAYGQRPASVDGSDGRRWPWDRVRIVSALCRETGVDLSLAEEVAREVEQTIILAGLGSVTAPLVRELVNVKLLERGLEAIRRKHARLGLPVYDVLGSIADAHDRLDLPWQIGQEVLAQLAMWHLFPSELSDLHRDRLLYIHDLGCIHLPRSRRVNLFDLIERGTSPEATAGRLLALRSTVNHHLTVVWEPTDHCCEFDSAWFVRLLNALTFGQVPVVTEFEIHVRPNLTTAVSPLLEAAQHLASQSGSLGSLVQIVVPVNDSDAIDLDQFQACWSAGIVCFEVGGKGGENLSSHRLHEVRCKFSIDIGPLCLASYGDMDRIARELEKILGLLARSARELQGALTAGPRAKQALLWPDFADLAVIQVGLFGVEKAAELLGVAGWRKLTDQLLYLQSRSLATRLRILLSDAAGPAVRSWFGEEVAPGNRIVPTLKQVRLFEGGAEWDPWTQLPDVRRFEAIDLKSLSSGFLSDVMCLGASRRLGYAGRRAWCSMCRRPLAPENDTCLSCPDDWKRTIIVERVGWFFRPIDHLWRTGKGGSARESRKKLT